MVPEHNEDMNNIFSHRLSVTLTPENAKFFHSKGGLISMHFTAPDGSEETFERVEIIRAFPITNPDEYLAVRNASGGRRDEIGLIHSIHDFDEETVALLNEELINKAPNSGIIKKGNDIQVIFGLQVADVRKSVEDYLETL